METALYDKFKNSYREFIKGAHQYQTKENLSPELESLAKTASDNKFVLYDLWESEPKVVFILDPWHCRTRTLLL